MDGSGYRYSGGDRKMEIVSGKSASAYHSYGGARPRSPDLPPIPQRVNRVSHSSSSSSLPAPWKLKDPEMKRKKRIAKYKVYTVEGKVKASLRKGLRWMKNKCSQIVRGY